MFKKTGLWVLIAAVSLMTGNAMAQQGSTRSVANADSQYVVTDTAVIVYYQEGKAVPYKVYDYSTRQVYVYLGSDQGFAHSFTELAPEETSYILQTVCTDVQLTNKFKRFCK